MTETRHLDGPIGIVGAGYIGHLFAQQFALAGYDVRAWSPTSSIHTLQDRLRESLAALEEIGAVAPSDIDGLLTRVSVYTDMADALAPCAAVMESIVENAEVKSACYRQIEAAVSDDALVWSSTSNFPMTRLPRTWSTPSGPSWFIRCRRS